MERVADSSSMQSRVLSWLPAAIGLAIIAGESTSSLSAEHTSRWLLPAWIWLLGPITAERWAVVHHLIRKVGHFMGYGALSITWFYGWNTTWSSRPWTRERVWMTALSMAVACTFLTACADEFHQSFLPSRTSSLIDVAIDSAGAVVAQGCTFVFLRLRRRLASNAGK